MKPPLCTLPDWYYWSAGLLTNERCNVPCHIKGVLTAVLVCLFVHIALFVDFILVQFWESQRIQQASLWAHTQALPVNSTVLTPTPLPHMLIVSVCNGVFFLRVCHNIFLISNMLKLYNVLLFFSVRAYNWSQNCAKLIYGLPIGFSKEMGILCQAWWSVSLWPFFCFVAELYHGHKVTADHSVFV